jgi:hypothetical protein
MLMYYQNYQGNKSNKIDIDGPDIECPECSPRQIKGYIAPFQSINFLHGIEIIGLKQVYFIESQHDVVLNKLIRWICIPCGRKKVI